MMTMRKISILAATLLVLSMTVLVGCAAEEDAAVIAADYTGTATKLFDAHGGGYIGEAIVSTDKDANVTSAVVNEWQGPGGWAEYTGTNTALVGGEIIRFKFPIKNLTAGSGTEAVGYCFFYYNISSKGWVELSMPTTSTAAWTAPSPTNATATPNFDAKMANPLYAEAYVAACKADNATDLVNVTIASSAIGAFPVITVGSKASTTVHYGNMNKTNAASTYMPMTTSSIGYRENMKALVAFFAANPTADYSASVATASTAMGTYTSDYATAVNYTNTTDTVWFVADAVTGATLSDFPHYALELQNAYLFSLSDAKGGDQRSLY